MNYKIGIYILFGFFLLPVILWGGENHSTLPVAIANQYEHIGYNYFDDFQMPVGQYHRETMEEALRSWIAAGHCPDVLKSPRFVFLDVTRPKFVLVTFPEAANDQNAKQFLITLPEVWSPSQGLKPAKVWMLDEILPSSQEAYDNYIRRVRDQGIPPIFITWMISRNGGVPQKEIKPGAIEWEPQALARFLQQPPPPLLIQKKILAMSEFELNAIGSPLDLPVLSGYLKSAANSNKKKNSADESINVLIDEARLLFAVRELGDEMLGDFLTRTKVSHLSAVQGIDDELHYRFTTGEGLIKSGRQLVFGAIIGIGVTEAMLAVGITAATVVSLPVIGTVTVGGLVISVGVLVIGGTVYYVIASSESDYELGRRLTGVGVDTILFSGGSMVGANIGSKLAGGWMGNRFPGRDLTWNEFVQGKMEWNGLGGRPKLIELPSRPSMATDTSMVATTTTTITTPQVSGAVALAPAPQIAPPVPQPVLGFFPFSSPNPLLDYLQQHLELQRKRYQMVDEEIKNQVDFYTWLFLGAPNTKQDFHQRVAALGMLPSQLRSLGLDPYNIFPTAVEAAWPSYQEYVYRVGEVNAAPFWLYLFAGGKIQQPWKEIFDPQRTELGEVAKAIQEEKLAKLNFFEMPDRAVYNKIYRRLISLFGDEVTDLFPQFDQFYAFVLVFEATDTMRMFLNSQRLIFEEAIIQDEWSSLRVALYEQLGFDFASKDGVRVPTIFQFSRNLVTFMKERGFLPEEILPPAFIVNGGRSSRLIMVIPYGLQYPRSAAFGNAGGLSLQELQALFVEGWQSLVASSSSNTHSLWHDMNHAIGRALNRLYSIASIRGFRTLVNPKSIDNGTEDYRHAPIYWSHEAVRMLRITQEELLERFCLPNQFRTQPQYRVSSLKTYLQTLTPEALVALAEKLYTDLPTLLEALGAGVNDRFTIYRDFLLRELTLRMNQYNVALLERYLGQLHRALYIEQGETPRAVDLEGAIDSTAALLTYLLQLSITDLGALVDSAFAPTLSPNSEYFRFMHESELLPPP